mgnify:CR=1 FL=1
MFSLFLSKVASEEVECGFANNSCLLCIEQPGCFYCHSTHSCDIAENNETCPVLSFKRDLQCVKMLGGDANPMVRYIIGGCFAAVAIAVDLIVRFCSREPAANEYAGL